jgi:hypothetical protein
MKNRYIVPQKCLGVQELVIKPEITNTNGNNFTVKAMIDSGCTHTCINEKTVIRKDIPESNCPDPSHAPIPTEQSAEINQLRIL